MRKHFVVIFLMFISVLSFSQQNMPGKIIGQIPNVNSTKLYQIQVGAFRNSKNAENVSLRLKREGLSPVYENYFDYTRVMITGARANQIQNYLIKIRQIGFNEVIIREDKTSDTISEKWEITTPGSAFSSFEFNQDHNYIAVKNPSVESDNPVRFGKYTMSAKDVINLSDLGVIKIKDDNSKNLNISFSPINEPGREVSFSAVKAERMPESREIDIFCRTWKVVNCTTKENIGMLLFISNAGTYFFTTPGGEANSLSKWRWYNNQHKEFEYSHDNWQHYGRVEIRKLTREKMDIFDPGFFTIIPGYSSADLNTLYELVPVSY
jgi:hypothetical protein